MMPRWRLLLGWLPAIAAAAICSRGAARAEEPPAEPARQWARVDWNVDLKFAPQSAYFFVDFSAGNTRRIPAVFVPVHKESAADEGRVTWVVGARVEYPAGSEIESFSLILVGAENEYAMVPPVRWSAYLAQGGFASADELREHLLKRKEELNALNSRFRAQSDELRRVQADADQMAESGRIRAAEDEKAALSGRLESLDKDTANLSRFISLVKSQPPPQSYQRRERELTRQIAELAEAAKRTEAGEAVRRSEGEAFNQKLELMLAEAAKLDEGELKRELAQLRRRRELLELKPKRQTDVSDYLFGDN